jgi:N-acyl-D-aspartate/D-glutamate deacylase
MTDEMQKVWQALRSIYGMDLTAATLVVLTKDGETAVKFQTIYFPQAETKNDTHR